MNDQNNATIPARRLGEYLHQLRTQRGVSIRALAAAARVDATWLSRVERGVFASPDARSLGRLAVALGVQEADVFLAAGFERGETLPSYSMYLRSKYELPEDAVAALSKYFDYINQQYGNQTGGSDGSDHHNSA